MKDTAVKFLIDEISCRFIISEELRIAMYKAIEMEKEQIMMAVQDAWFMAKGSNYQEPQAEEYYNETFKSE